ncbi:polysaccharide deacetylase family protein [Jeotgalibacillus proteolyticus]|uniref:Oligosaccharide deacetylase n=1 Tax=Jeotgalibacillus proteolyticus TaxID=2082395 RepID=A0A2S5G827_9BACL|nr:polysaccharide deacetylase family protein [Jeotgalibacillus proteolyticus]PPA69105.1 oligosaccharide deacetylase [Jeotgalibacillus proteolyticus]
MMKKNIACFLSFFLLFFIFTAASDASTDNKGRQYYEESGLILWDIKTKKKVIALTFDDGPHRKYTPQVLDLLEKYEARATFFIIGENVLKNPEVVSRMYLEGHELANHTFTHPTRITIPDLQKEIKRTNDLISSITGFNPNLFRPVEGHYTDEMVEQIGNDGFKVVMWSWHQDTEDWREPGVDHIVNRVLKGTKPGDVVLFHDGGGNRKQTVAALEKILIELQRQEYEFVTISELLAIQEAENGNQ